MCKTKQRNEDYVKAKIEKKIADVGYLVIDTKHQSYNKRMQ